MNIILEIAILVAIIYNIIENGFVEGIENTVAATIPGGIVGGITAEILGINGPEISDYIIGGGLVSLILLTLLLFLANQGLFSKKTKHYSEKGNANTARYEWMTIHLIEQLKEFVLLAKKIKESGNVLITPINIVCRLDDIGIHIIADFSVRDLITTPFRDIENQYDIIMGKIEPESNILQTELKHSDFLAFNPRMGADDYMKRYTIFLKAAHTAIYQSIYNERDSWTPSAAIDRYEWSVDSYPVGNVNFRTRELFSAEKDLKRTLNRIGEELGNVFVGMSIYKYDTALQITL